LSLAVLSCGPPLKERVTAEQAIVHLNAGQVKTLGVSESGWVQMTLKDGHTLSVRDHKIGQPEEILKRCTNCGDVAVWIE
jgi:hypothetical protein